MLDYVKLRLNPASRPLRRCVPMPLEAIRTMRKFTLCHNKTGSGKFGAKLKTLLAAGLAIASLALAAPAMAQAPAATPPPPPSGDDLEYAKIEEAIDAAVKALYKIPPNWTFPAEHIVNHTYNQAVINETGNHALAIWAMLRAGESYQSPQIYRVLNWVLSSDSANTYDRAMRATMLNELPHDRWEGWIKRDAVWLTQAITDKGNFTETYAGVPLVGYGDNADGQYGVFALANIENTGKYAVPRDTWSKIDTYWRQAQDKNTGGWGVFSFGQVNDPQSATRGIGVRASNTFYSRVSGPMTAGGVAALSYTERYLKGSTLLEPSPNNVSENLKKGIAWLDKNFNPNDKEESTDTFYYYWTIQRVGSATGYRRFNGTDWFRDITAMLLSKQQPTGVFLGDKGNQLSTGFALLYLCRANDPMAISKVRFKKGAVEGNWNNRPHDIWNFTDYASDIYEVKTTWQIAEPAQPVHELIEAPVMYLATDQFHTFTDQEVNNLRTYMEAGGVLVCNPEDGKGEAMKTYKELAKKIFPTKELEKVDNQGKDAHPIYDLHAKVPTGATFSMISNSIRPMMIVLNTDISKGLQANDASRAAGFPLLSNIYLYATGKNTKRGRLQNNFLFQKPGPTSQSISVARIKHSGNFDPEPNALRQMKAMFANTWKIDLQFKDVSPKDLKDQKIAFLTTVGDGSLSSDEAAAVKKWVESGGVLWLDAAGGSTSALDKAREFLTKIAPQATMSQVSSDHPIITGSGLQGGFDNKRVKYRFFTLVGDTRQGGMGPVFTPRLQIVKLTDSDKQGVIIYSAEDLTCGMAGLEHWRIFGYSVDFARRLVANGILQAHMNAGPQ
jgi:hypothetical protein